MITNRLETPNELNDPDNRSSSIRLVAGETKWRWVLRARTSCTERGIPCQRNDACLIICGTTQRELPAIPLGNLTPVESLLAEFKRGHTKNSLHRQSGFGSVHHASATKRLIPS